MRTLTVDEFADQLAAIVIAEIEKSGPEPPEGVPDHPETLKTRESRATTPARGNSAGA